MEIIQLKDKLITLDYSIENILKKLKDLGLRSYVVGGAVRDALLGISPKDIDIEVYGINYEDLMNILSEYGKVDLVGKKFGVIVFCPNDGELKYDFSIPRRENKSGVGHKEFEIEFSPDMTISDACERRDLTFNALCYDPLENIIYDCYGGLSDLNNKIIKHTSDKFEEDYLRILRIMGFQSRLDFDIDFNTIEKIYVMLGESYDSKNEFLKLPKERLFEEFKKWAEKGVVHDGIFSFMRRTNLINYFPQLKLLKETKQDPIYHPEGDVEIHTELCIKHMDSIINNNNIIGDEKIILIMSILLHDIAKPNTTEEMLKNGRMTITSHGHEALGGVIAREFLESIGFHEHLIVPICKLVENHLSGVNISQITSPSGKIKAVKKLSRRLYPATINQLLYVMEADTNGRGSLEYKEPSGYTDIKNIASSLDLTQSTYEFLMKGRHLIQLGLKPSNEFGAILQTCNDAQENGEFNDVEGGIIWLSEYLKLK